MAQSICPVRIRTRPRWRMLPRNWQRTAFACTRNAAVPDARRGTRPDSQGYEQRSTVSQRSFCLAPVLPQRRNRAGERDGFGEFVDETGWFLFPRLPRGEQRCHDTPSRSCLPGDIDAQVHPTRHWTEVLRFCHQRAPVIGALLEQGGFALLAVGQPSVSKHARSFLNFSTVPTKALRAFRRDCRARQASAVPTR